MSYDEAGGFYEVKAGSVVVMRLYGANGSLIQRVNSVVLLDGKTLRGSDSAHSIFEHGTR